ncbi:hypothetical protein IEQ34_000491 [Dendrobium chrysotoxum]|uniref:DUF7138 domain-containing protein n=1 Tax=Dendrobium chrysotoxum TaxID=161865 RepID=A0AAV7HT28_DENCH|nr:hypothetical protein IEQ34_000491 [Dendrobium chrysotoxum]
METSKALTSYPASFFIIFFNGIKEADVGNIFMSPSTSYKIFKRLISLKLGIPSRQILTYLVHQNNVISSLEIRRKVRINELNRQREGLLHPCISKRFPMKWWNMDIPIAVGLRQWNYESQLEYLQKKREMYLMLNDM